MFISIHFNAARDPDAQGTETYYYTDLGRRLAEKIHKNVLSKVGFEDRGIKKRGFYVCREIVSIPSILIEPLFLSNKKGEGWIREEVNVKKLAEGIQLGIKEFFQEPI
jgi:N-acetylmuramoyl-L-alanine amidase